MKGMEAAKHPFVIFMKAFDPMFTFGDAGPRDI